MPTSQLVRGFFALVLVLLFSSGSSAQSSSALGSLSGTVLDPQFRPVAGAQVILRSMDFASTRTLVSDDGGHFLASFLPVGSYLLEVHATGFEVKKPVRLNIGAGSNTVIDVRLSMSVKSESLTVTGQGQTVEGNTTISAVNRQEPIVANQIAGLTVTYLPSRNRDFSQMAQLAAGSDADPDATGLVVAGQRPESTRIAIDGAAFNDPLRGGERGQEDGALFFPQVVVREFQLVHSGATAEVGGTNAGFVNVATKSGSNKVRGEAFYVARPAAFGSDDPFGHSLENRQHLFGGAIGGPIKRDRAFFYFGLEQDFLRIPYWAQFAEQPAAVTVPPALASLQQQIISENNPTAIFARGDFNLSTTHTLNVQLNYNHVDASNLPDGFVRTLSTEANGSSMSGQSVWARASLTSVLSPSRVNHVLASWETDHRTLDPNSNLPEIFVNGFGVLGGNAFRPHRYTSKSLQVSDDLSFIHRHANVNMGGSFAYSPARDFHQPFLNGRFDYSSFDDFALGNIRRYRQTFPAGNAVYDESISYASLYFSIKNPLTNSLTLSAGLRWEGQFNPENSVARVPSDFSQWQPRFGLAWSPRSRTVLRLSTGLYDATTPAAVLERIFTNDGTKTRTIDSYYDPQLLPLLTTQQAFTSLPAVVALDSSLTYGIADDFRNPRSFQVAASIEQQVSRKVNVTLGYLRNSTWALQRLVNRNLFAPAYTAEGVPVFPATRPSDSVGEVLVSESNGHSTYDGFTVTSVAQLPKRSQLTINYTTSRSRDNGSRFDPFQPIEALDPFNVSVDEGYSDFDIRHSLNISAVFNLPAGFKMNPILIARSGAPYTPIVGFDTQRDGLEFNDRAVLNGRMARRNSLRQPSLANLDLRFVKDFTLKGEGHHLDLFLDIFNITGASNLNFGSQAVSFFGSTATPIVTAGQPLFAPATTRMGGPRTVQFTARLVAF